MVSDQRNNSSDTEREVLLDLGAVTLEATLARPNSAKGIVLFAHGSGSNRKSPRNRYVASVLQSQGVATLLFDLLTCEEGAADARTSAFRFDIPLLTKRLHDATLTILRDPQTKKLSVGYFGASTGAAAALQAAAQMPDRVAAVVSRGGRPDLAGSALACVRAPTLLIAGGADQHVIELNRQALDKLGASVKKMVLVPGASHLFEEPGKLAEVARLAADWFTRHLGPVHTPSSQPSGPA